MIIDFAVSNFGPIKDEVTLSFEADKTDNLEEYYIINENTCGIRLLKLGFIYGPNASGKTTILKALDFLRDLVTEPLSKKTDTFNYLPFLFDKDTPEKNTTFTLNFIHNNKRYLYKVEINKRAVVREELFNFDPKKANVFDRTTDMEKELTTISFGGKITKDKKNKFKKIYQEAIESNTLWNNTVIGGFLKTNIEMPVLKEVADWFRLILYPVIYPDTPLLGFTTKKISDGSIKKDSILKYLNTADMGISDIIFNEKEEEVPEYIINLLEKEAKIKPETLAKIKKEKKIISQEVLFNHKINNTENYQLPGEEESSGTKKYYGLSSILDLICKNISVLSIDEIESSLHPDLIKHFLLTFLANSKKGQLILTTHWRELFLERDILRDDAIWFTEKKNDGSIELFSLADFDTSVLRPTSSLYNAYKAGRLGARPNLGDYELGGSDGA